MMESGNYLTTFTSIFSKRDVHVQYQVHKIVSPQKSRMIHEVITELSEATELKSFLICLEACELSIPREEGYLMLQDSAIIISEKQ